MGTILAPAIIDKVEIVLQDTTNIRWPVLELLGWLNDGQRAICAVLPELNAITGTLPLVAGTRQLLPAGGIMLLKVTRNMGAAGTTPGGALRKVPQELLDSQVPEWHAQTGVTALKHYVFDPRSPKVFYVYPPSVAPNNVEALYTASPLDVPSAETRATTYSQTTTVVTVTLTNHGFQAGSWIAVVPGSGTLAPQYAQVTAVTAANSFTFSTPTSTSTSGAASVIACVNLDDVYANPLMDYMLYRAYSKDLELAGNDARASEAFKAFSGTLAAKKSVDAANVPVDFTRG